MNSLDANFYEVHPKIVQTPAALSRDNWSKPYSPVFLYKWDDAYNSVKKDGVYEYSNPLTGGPVMPTMGARLELVRDSKPRRHTGSIVYQVASGRGWSRSETSASNGRRKTSSSCPRGPAIGTARTARPCFSPSTISRQ